MNASIGFRVFARVFWANIEARSRTAHGISDTSVSAQKKPPLLSGAALRRQVTKNTNALIRLVWCDAKGGALPGPQDLRMMMERWYDAINRDLQNTDAYRNEYETLCRETELLRRETGLSYRMNSRYRVWTLAYTGEEPPPRELERAMDRFYHELREKIIAAQQGMLVQAELLAYADHTMHGVIHPWADGNGRMATAAVMWLSLLVHGYSLPIFGMRHNNNRTLWDAAYYRECLARA